MQAFRGQSQGFDVYWKDCFEAAHLVLQFFQRQLLQLTHCTTSQTEPKMSWNENSLDGAAAFVRYLDITPKTSPASMLTSDLDPLFELRVLQRL